MESAAELRLSLVGYKVHRSGSVECVATEVEVFAHSAVTQR